MNFTSGAPQKSGIRTGSVLRSNAGARLLAATGIIPIYPDGSVAYLTDFRRKKIYRLNPQQSGQIPFSVGASRGLVNPDSGITGIIDGNPEGCIYHEPLYTRRSDSPLVHYTYSNGFQRDWISSVHVLDQDLNRVESLIFMWGQMQFTNGIPNGEIAPTNNLVLGGALFIVNGSTTTWSGRQDIKGDRGTVVVPVHGGTTGIAWLLPANLWLANNSPSVFAVAFDLNTLKGAADRVIAGSNNCTMYLYDVQRISDGNYHNVPVANSYPLASLASVGTQYLPAIVGGHGGAIYGATNTAITRFSANGLLTAYTDPSTGSGSSGHPQYPPYALDLSGSETICYTSAWNFAGIWVRDSDLNITRRVITQTEYNIMLGPDANGQNPTMYPSGFGGI